MVLTPHGVPLFLTAVPSTAGADRVFRGGQRHHSRSFDSQPNRDASRGSWQGTDGTGEEQKGCPGEGLSIGGVGIYESVILRKAFVHRERKTIPYLIRQS